jgi:plastocyanin
MKKIITHALTFVLAFVVTTTYASTHNVTVTDASFSPSNFNAAVGDTVLWTFSANNYYQNNTASTSVPVGAATWSSGALSGGATYMYVITTAGSYSYNSSAWDAFSGSFTVTAPNAPSTTLHNITITDYAFSPDTLTAQIGDTIIWTAASGNLWLVNSASLTVPTGAATWSSGGLNPNQSFMYVVATAGAYT